MLRPSTRLKSVRLREMTPTLDPSGFLYLFLNFLRANQEDRPEVFPSRLLTTPSPVNPAVNHVNLVNLTFQYLQLARWRGANYPRSVGKLEGPVKQKGPTAM